MAQHRQDTSPPGDLGRLIQSPFARVRTLLEGIEPGASPIDMTIGEPRHGLPASLAGALDAAFAGYAKYPPMQGTPELLAAIGAWIERRYPNLLGAIVPARHILPLNGTREGLFSAIFPATARRGAAARRC
jgi:N-succinyldiaminopimelate aminotransferase